MDKPGKSRDYYHTCYTLSGLSVAQHMPCDRRTVLGDPANLLVCMLGVVRGAILYYRALNFFEFEVATCRTCRLKSKKAILEVASSNLKKW